MEYLPLGDLGRYLNNPFPEDEALAITRQLIEGLGFMHSKLGLAHRDLKPEVRHQMVMGVLSPLPVIYMRLTSGP